MEGKEAGTTGSKPPSSSPLALVDVGFLHQRTKFLSSSQPPLENQFNPSSEYADIPTSLTMFTSRTAARAAARSAHTPLRASRLVRFQSVNQQAAKAGGSSGLVGGLAGGGLVFLVRFSSPVILAN